MFKLRSEYKPSWDQPKAIKQILDGFENDENIITLLWATWTGKTFTMANIIKKLNKPTLILSHNKTLAAQLATEFKYFFPNNAVHYFVSYFDYYQPEAYIKERDIYIKKESTVNQAIEMYRLSTMASLLSRKDTIVVSSVSALYWLWDKKIFSDNTIHFKIWKKYDYDELKKKLIAMQYKPALSKIEQWTFDFKWEILDIYSSLDSVVYRLFFNFNKLELIQKKDSLTFKELWKTEQVTIRPAIQFLQNMESLDEILWEIKLDLDDRVKQLKKEWKLIEANRLEKKTNYDIRMIQETWHTNWIENYSKYFDRRQEWQPPNTLFDYLEDNFFVIVDESHMTIPQLRWMFYWDASRKESLIDNWFRLPSSRDHRPISLEELSYVLWWKFENKSNEKTNRFNFDLLKKKKDIKTLFVSATPWKEELSICDKLVEQIIRPTWLVDPLTYVYPKSGDYSMLESSLKELLAKNPELKDYLDEYNLDEDSKHFIFNDFFK